jgi:hypothetical protein
MCQPVSSHGKSPSTTPGAITRKTTVPAAALISRIGPPAKHSRSHKRHST